MIRVVIADDQALVRGGLRMILEAQPDIEVVGEAATGNEAVHQAHLHRPAVVLMDVRMPGMDGIEATTLLMADEARHRPRVLMLTTFDLDEHVYDAMKAGASGFLLKNAPPDQLCDAVRTIAAGETLLAPSITRRLIEEFVSRPRARTGRPVELADLTARELEVLALIGRGFSNTEIATTLVLSEATVRTHANRIYTKLSLRDRTQAAVLAYETGLIRPGEQFSTDPNTRLS